MPNLFILKILGYKHIFKLHIFLLYLLTWSYFVLYCFWKKKKKKRKFPHLKFYILVNLYYWNFWFLLFFLNCKLWLFLPKTTTSVSFSFFVIILRKYLYEVCVVLSFVITCTYLQIKNTIKKKWGKTKCWLK